MANLYLFKSNNLTLLFPRVEELGSGIESPKQIATHKNKHNLKQKQNQEWPTTRSKRMIGGWSVGVCVPLCGVCVGGVCLFVCWSVMPNLHSKPPVPGAEGCSDSVQVGQGCAARASKPLPIFKGHFGRKRYSCFRIFLEKQAHFSQIFALSGFSPCENLKIWAQSENWTHV